jgi:hypothetical protein
MTTCYQLVPFLDRDAERHSYHRHRMKEINPPNIRALLRRHLEDACRLVRGGGADIVFWNHGPGYGTWLEHAEKASKVAGQHGTLKDIANADDDLFGETQPAHEFSIPATEMRAAMKLFAHSGLRVALCDVVIAGGKTTPICLLVQEPVSAAPAKSEETDDLGDLM